jgi:hypothetical protein
MVQEIEMTKEEQMTMYMKCSKKELCEMLIEANKHLKNLPIHVVVVPKGTLVCPETKEICKRKDTYYCNRLCERI